MMMVIVTVDSHLQQVRSFLYLILQLCLIIVMLRFYRIRILTCAYRIVDKYAWSRILLGATRPAVQNRPASSFAGPSAKPRLFCLFWRYSKALCFTFASGSSVAWPANQTRPVLMMVRCTAFQRHTAPISSCPCYHFCSKPQTLVKTALLLLS